jgi:hypothetical protein
MMNGVIPVALGVAVETVGSVGAVAAMPMVGATPTVGTAAAELTPRLPISVDPNGIPVRATPPGVIGDVGAEAMLLEPEPHMPDMPNPEVVDIPDDVDMPDDVGIPAVAAVAGVSVPTSVPPPSKVAVDPNVPTGAVPAVEHVVLLPGIVIVAVESVGAGLIPGDASSVDPSGIPVGETGVSAAIPSGEVAPMAGVGGAMPPTCAMATLQVNSTGMTAAASDIGILDRPIALPQPAPMSISLATSLLGARISDIGQSLSNDSRGEPIRWRHELRSHWILDGLFEDAIDLHHRGGVDVPSHHAIDRG